MIGQKDQKHRQALTKKLLQKDKTLGQYQKSHPTKLSQVKSLMDPETIFKQIKDRRQCIENLEQQRFKNFSHHYQNMNQLKIAMVSKEQKQISKWSQYTEISLQTIRVTQKTHGQSLLQYYKELEELQEKMKKLKKSKNDQTQM